MSKPLAVLNQTQSKTYEVVRGAPLPITVRLKVYVVYVGWAASLTLTVKPPGTAAFDLTVGQGITLSTYNSVANAQAVLQLTEAQSNLVAKGDFTTFLLTEGAAGAKVPRLRGKLIGVDM